MRPICTVLAFSVISFFYVLISAEAFVNGIPSIKSTPRLSRRSAISSKLDISAVRSFTAAVVATAATPVAAVAPSTVGTVVAKFLGYVIGAGSLAVYLPIVISLLNKKSADGFSVATWVFNLMGITLAVIYPLKKGFPMSTFVELVLLVIQSTGILGKPYLIGGLVIGQLTQNILNVYNLFIFCTQALSVTTKACGRNMQPVCSLTFSSLLL
jgi:PQ loop repeat